MALSAVLQVGNHQYQVAENTVFDVELFEHSDQKDVEFQEVLVLGTGEEAQIGQPFVPKAKIVCEIEKELRLPKVISFKYKRRKGYRRKKGHRQSVIRLRVKSIQTE